MRGARREQVLDAAIEVLGTEGVRGLTHRAADAAAGLPAGSASNYFRTRQALLEAIVGHLVMKDQQDWEAMARLAEPDDVEALARALADYVAYATGPARGRTVARLALFLEAAVREELRPVLMASRAAIIRWGSVRLQRLGSTTPEVDSRRVLDYLEGLILHQLAFPGPSFDPTVDLRRILAATVTAA